MNSLMISSQRRLRHVVLAACLIVTLGFVQDRPNPGGAGSEYHPIIRDLERFLDRHKDDLAAPVRAELVEILDRHRGGLRVQSASAQKPKKCSGTLVIEDFNSCQPSRNLLDGEAGTYHTDQRRAAGENELFHEYEGLTPGDCALRLPYAVKRKGAMVGYWSRLKGQDWSAHLTEGRQLCFWVKGKKGADFTRGLKVDLKSEHGRVSRGRFVLGITDEWQEFCIPLSDFGLPSWTDMYELAFTFAHEDLERNHEHLVGTIFIDNVAIR